MIDADLVIALIEGMSDARTRASDYERERSALLVRLAQLRKVEAAARGVLPHCELCDDGGRFKALRAALAEVGK